MKICKVKGCKNSSSCKQKGCKGYCRRHYRQLLKYGKILKRTKFDPNEIIDCGDYYEICLYKGRKEQTEVSRAKIDKDDLDKVKQYKWSIAGHGYVINASNKIKLHQFILGKKKGYEIDHINHDKLDNRKENLRHCTRSQNNRNRKFKGYSFNKPIKKWLVQIVFNNKTFHIGCFKKEKDAIKARREAEQKYFGEFAYKY